MRTGRRLNYRKDDYVAITKVAALAICEQKLLLLRRLGDRATPGQRAARTEGDRQHAQFDRKVRAHHNRKRERPSAGDRRCFIATAVYGIDDPRTQALRRYRDARLAGTVPGRAFIWFYYALSPAVAWLLERWPAGRTATGWCLDRLRKTWGLE